MPLSRIFRRPNLAIATSSMPEVEDGRAARDMSCSGLASVA
jgi:hypothetical protein